MKRLFVAIIVVLAVSMTACAGFRMSNGNYGIGEYAGLDLSLGYGHNFGNNNFDISSPDYYKNYGNSVSGSGNMFAEDRIDTEVKVLFRTPTYMGR